MSVEKMNFLKGCCEISVDLITQSSSRQVQGKQSAVGGFETSGTYFTTDTANFVYDKQPEDDSSTNFTVNESYDGSITMGFYSYDPSTATAQEISDARDASYSGSKTGSYTAGYTLNRAATEENTSYGWVNNSQYERHETKTWTNEENWRTATETEPVEGFSSGNHSVYLSPVVRTISGTTMHRVVTYSWTGTPDTGDQLPDNIDEGGESYSNQNNAANRSISDSIISEVQSNTTKTVDTANLDADETLEGTRTLGGEVAQLQTANATVGAINASEWSEPSSGSSDISQASQGSLLDVLYTQSRVRFGYARVDQPEPPAQQLTPNKAQYLNVEYELFEYNAKTEETTSLSGVQTTTWSGSGDEQNDDESNYTSWIVLPNPTWTPDMTDAEISGTYVGCRLLRYQCFTNSKWKVVNKPLE